MKINTLRDNMRQVNVQGTITEVGDTRTVNLRAGGEAQVAEAQLKDETGTIALSLWDDQIEQVARGSVVEVLNGYTSQFRGELKVSIGKYGRLIVQAEGSDLDQPQFGEV